MTGCWFVPAIHRSGWSPMLQEVVATAKAAMPPVWPKPRALGRSPTMTSGPRNPWPVAASVAELAAVLWLIVIAEESVRAWGREEPAARDQTGMTAKKAVARTTPAVGRGRRAPGRHSLSPVVRNCSPRSGDVGGASGRAVGPPMCNGPPKVRARPKRGPSATPTLLPQNPVVRCRAPPARVCILSTPELHRGAGGRSADRRYPLRRNRAERPVAEHQSMRFSMPFQGSVRFRYECSPK